MSRLKHLSFVWVIAPVMAVWAADTSPVALLIAHGHFKQARPVLEKRLSANPKDAEALVLMAKLKLAYQDSDGAVQLAKQAMDADPKNVAAHVTFAEAMGRKADKAGMFDKIRIARQLKSELEMAVSLDPKNIDALEGMTDFYREAPGITGGSMSKAREFADKIMAIDPVRGYFAKVDIATQEKQTDQYEGLYLKALEANPKSYEVNIRLAGLYTSDKWKNYDKAAQYAQKALQLDPSRVGAYAVLAQIDVVKEQWSELDQLLAKSEKEIPDNFSPYYVSARTMLLSGKDLPRAERYFRKYLTQEPEGGTPPLAAAHWRLGQVLDKQGKKDEALKEIQLGVDLKPGLDKAALEAAQKDLKRLKG